MKYSYRKHLSNIKTNIINSVSTAVLVFSSVAGGLPLFMSQKAYALPAASYTQVPFGELANWTADRTTPSGGYTTLTSEAGHNDVLNVKVDNTKASPASGFYRTEGLQRQIPASDTIKADLYVDGSWITPHKDVRAGLWAVAKDSESTTIAYPIIEFTTTGDNNFTGWRVFDGVNGGWTNLPTVAYSENAWNTVEISLNKVTHQFNLNINGTLATSNAADTTTSIGAIILNDYNYATTADNNYSVNWSNLAYGNFLPVVPTITNVTGDTAAGEDQPGWLFNRDITTATPFEFTTNEHSTGTGSLYVKPIGTNPSNKMVAENFDKVPVADLSSISYDYRIAGNGTSSSANQFYLNVYANIDNSNNYYDCRFDYVPTAGSTTGFTTASFASTATPVNVQQRSSSRITCPTTLAGMPAGSMVRMSSISVGDTSANDTGLAGYLDNIVVNKLSGTTAYDFEPMVPDTTGPTITGLTVTNKALWGVDYDILSKANHASESTHLPVVGGTIQIGANFNDDRLLTNVIAYLPGLGFFDASTFTPNLTNSWTGIISGKYIVNWDTKNATDWRKVPDGNYDFSFNARDGGNGQNAFQNNTYSSTRLTVDNTGPSIEFVTPTPTENMLVSGNITVNGKFTDANGLMNTDIGVHNDGRTGEGWKCHTDWPTQGTKSCQIDTTQLADGTYKLTMAGRDKAGNVTQVFRTISVDNNPPTTLSVSLNAGGAAVATSGYTSSRTFAFNLSAAGATRYQLKYWNDITGDQFNGEGNAWNPTNLSGYSTNPAQLGVYVDQFTRGEGTHHFAFSACDAAGNCMDYSTPFVVTYDKTAPLATITAPTSTLLNGNVVVNGTVTDVNPDHYYFVVKNSLGSVVAGPGTVVNQKVVLSWNWDTTSVSNGVYTIDLEARDKANNKNNGSVATMIVTVNNTIKTAPTPLTVTGPAATVAPNAGNINGNGTTANAGNAQLLAAATNNTPAVLGATDVKSDTIGQVKGATTDKKEVAIVAAQKSGAVLGLGWWWLAVMAAIVGFFGIVFLRGNSNSKT